jgi:Vacuolar-sorting-associated 13 protein C-terminal
MLRGTSHPVMLYPVFPSKHMIEKEKSKKMRFGSKSKGILHSIADNAVQLSRKSREIVKHIDEADKSQTLSVSITTAGHPVITHIEEMRLLLVRLALEVDDALIAALLKMVGSLVQPASSGKLFGSSTLESKAIMSKARHLALDKTGNSFESIAIAGMILDSGHGMNSLLESKLLSQASILTLAPESNPSRLYIGSLTLHPIAINMTFALLGDSRFLLEQLPPSLGYLRNFVDAFISVLASVDKAPLELASFATTNIFETSGQLSSRLTSHYLQGALREWYKILGSAEVYVFFFLMISLFISNSIYHVLSFLFLLDLVIH